MFGWYMTKRFLFLFLLSSVLFSACANAQDKMRNLIEMVRIPAGQFNMGSLELANTKPIHKVFLSRDVFMSKYEISNEIFCVVMNYLIDKGEVMADEKALWYVKTKQFILSLVNNPPLYYQFGLEYKKPYIKPIVGREKHPVVGITWYGSLAFCNGLSQIEKYTQVYSENVFLEQCNWNNDGYRLPTEAEWEYSARGGDKRKNYPWGDYIDGHYANYFSSGDPFEKNWPEPWSNGGPTSFIGYYNGETHGDFITKSNESPFGVFDMAGNVAEWCWDILGDDYSLIKSTINPNGQSKTMTYEPRVYRGGSWLNNQNDLRIYRREGLSPLSSAYDVGFRIVRIAR